MLNLRWPLASVRELAPRIPQRVARAYERTVGSLAALSYDPKLVWDEPWDLLVVLDVCRLDLATAIEPEYPFFNSPDSFESAGSSTVEWLEANFASEYADELARTAYVTGNPNSVRAAPYRFPDRCSCGTQLSPSHDAVYHDGTVHCDGCGTSTGGEREHHLALLDEVWRSAWDNDIGTIEPRPVTDRAVAASRSGAADRLIVHYMQPHQPFLNRPEMDRGHFIAPGDEERARRSRTVWERLRAGELDRETVWEAYEANLRQVLDDVELLLENVDAERAVITADHGNAMGEYGVYGHPPKVPLDSLVRVPWYTTSGTDKGSHRPTTDRDSDPGRAAGEGVRNRLRSLGYFQ